MILITRPRIEANKLKNIIEDLGYKVHIESLSRILFFDFVENLDSKAIILISSQRAAKIFIENYNGSKKLPLIVIGNISFQKLTMAGFTNILNKSKDSYHILKYIKKNLPLLKRKYGNKLIYLTGSVSNKGFVDNLKDLGINFEIKIIYKTAFKKTLSQSTIDLLNKNKINVCLLYSQKNAQHLCELIRKKNLSKKLKNVLILTLSKKISDVMKKNGYFLVKHSKYPSQKSLLNTLDRTRLL